MTPPPSADPSVYHITHVDNLGSIVNSGRLVSHAAVLAKGLEPVGIGYQHIKTRRRGRAVPLSAKGYLGDYVPFYFCPRSPMLYVISRGNSPDLGYRGGQAPIVHLVSTARTLATCGRPWTFTERHAQLAYAVFYDDLEQLAQLNWKAVRETSWGGDDDLKEQKQAECGFRPW